MTRLNPDQLKAIKVRRSQGETWKALAAEIGMTGQGLTRLMTQLYGKIELAEKKCLYCGKMFRPMRRECRHCGHPDCYTKHKKTWTRWDRRKGIKADPKKNRQMVVTCIGRFCGGQEFFSPITTDHGRERALYRLCPICRERNGEYCTAWGGY